MFAVVARGRDAPVRANTAPFLHGTCLPICARVADVNHGRPHLRACCVRHVVAVRGLKAGAWKPHSGDPGGRADSGSSSKDRRRPAPLRSFVFPPHPTPAAKSTAARQPRLQVRGFQIYGGDAIPRVPDNFDKRAPARESGSPRTNGRRSSAARNPSRARCNQREAPGDYVSRAGAPFLPAIGQSDTKGRSSDQHKVSATIARRERIARAEYRDAA